MQLRGTLTDQAPQIGQSPIEPPSLVLLDLGQIKTEYCQDTAGCGGDGAASNHMPERSAAAAELDILEQKCLNSWLHIAGCPVIEDLRKASLQCLRASSAHCRVPIAASNSTFL